MKRVVVIIAAFFLVANMGLAQDYNKLLKKASKNLSKYNMSPQDNADKLQEAMTLIDQAFESEEAKTSAKAWNTKGKIFSEMASTDINAKLLNPNPDAVLSQPTAGHTAYDAFKNAMKLAEKKGDIKDAIKGMQEVENHLSNTGIILYQVKDYAGAFKNFDGLMVASGMLQEKGKKSILDDPQAKNDQLFSTAVSGYYGEKYEEVKPYLLKLKEGEKPDAFVYDALYNITSKTDKEAAVKYLEEGRQMHPEETSLLFSEINYYLEAGKLEDLISKLQLAAEKEKDNMTVYVTLGNVYEQLSVKSHEAGDTTKSNEYFEESKKAYSYVIENAGDDTNSAFNATYSTGALYYNKAATYTDKLNALADDFSKSGTKKYNNLKKQMDELFNVSLPYFEKAEALNPGDGNTLIALKEIHARNNNFEKANEYKAKLEAAGIIGN